jgi:hypothetical protein
MSESDSISYQAQFLTPYQIVIIKKGYTRADGLYNNVLQEKPKFIVICIFEPPNSVQEHSHFYITFGFTKNPNACAS